MILATLNFLITSRGYAMRTGANRPSLLSQISRQFSKRIRIISNSAWQTVFRVYLQ